jgi:hypothetical protein
MQEVHFSEMFVMIYQTTGIISSFTLRSYEVLDLISTRKTMTWVPLKRC